MERYAWQGKVKDGCMDEYKRRHDGLWPEMKQLLKDAGICNYTIWTNGSDLFGYYECKKGIAFAAKTQVDSPLVSKWDEYMKDILIMEKDKITGAQPLLSEIFRLE